MFTPSFPPADSLLAFLAGINYRKLAWRILMLVATIAAVTVAVSQFAWRKGREFWAEHGDSIILHFNLFIERLVEVIERVYSWGQASRPVVNRWVALAADWLYYQIANYEGQYAN